MAKHGWIASIGLSVGTAAAAAATQFGLGYGLGIISWAPGGGTDISDEAWLASLAWTTFIAATSTVVGAVYADRRSAGSMPARTSEAGRLVPSGALAIAAWRTLLAFCAAVGALLCVALVLIPAQSATASGGPSPELIAAGYAIVGIVLGVVIGACALASRAAATNVIATSAVLWLFAVIAVVNAHLPNASATTAADGSRVPALGAWPFGPGTYFKATWSVEGTALMFGTALLIGAGAAWWASRRSESRVGVALSGAVGPLMTATAYLFSTPRLVGVDATRPQLSAYLVAPYAVIAGLVGSMIAVAVGTAWETNAGRRRDEVTETVPVTQAILPTPRTSQPAWLSGLDDSTLGSSGKGAKGSDRNCRRAAWRAARPAPAPPASPARRRRCATRTRPLRSSGRSPSRGAAAAASPRVSRTTRCARVGWTATGRHSGAASRVAPPACRCPRPPAAGPSRPARTPRCSGPGSGPR